MCPTTGLFGRASSGEAAPGGRPCFSLAVITVIVAFRSCAAVDGEHAGVAVVHRLDALQELHVVLRDLELDVCVGPHVVRVRGLREWQETQLEGVADRELRE